MSISQHTGTIWKVAGNENAGIVVTNEDTLGTYSLKTLSDIKNRVTGGTVTLSNVEFIDKEQRNVNYNKETGNWIKIDMKLYEMLLDENIVGARPNPVVSWSADFVPGSAGAKYIFVGNGTEKTFVVGEQVGDWATWTFDGTWKYDTETKTFTAPRPGGTYEYIEKQIVETELYGFICFISTGFAESEPK